MKRRLVYACLFLVLYFASTFAQSPKSYFPHNVGDRWDYWHSSYGYISNVLTRDSIGTDNSHYLFYDNDLVPELRIDTIQQVFQSPTYPGGFLLYKLNADSGSVWEGGPWRWAWVARVDTELIFSQSTVVKVFCFGVQHPDTGGWNRFYEEHHIALGFGLIYWAGEPAWVEFLQGCVIAGDTFGILTTGVTENHKLPPQEFSLVQNYPNPFNPSTTIEFELPKESFVNLAVFDVLGRQVAILTQGRLIAGRHRFLWSASSFPSGIYFCRIQANGYNHTIKMLLTK